MKWKEPDCASFLEECLFTSGSGFPAVTTSPVAMTVGTAMLHWFKRVSAINLLPAVQIAIRPSGIFSRRLVTPGRTLTPSVFSASRRSNWSTYSMVALCGTHSAIVSMVRRPCEVVRIYCYILEKQNTTMMAKFWQFLRNTFSGSKSCSRANSRQWRSTSGVVSMSVPSKSKTKAFARRTWWSSCWLMEKREKGAVSYSSVPSWTRLFQCGAPVTAEQCYSRWFS